MTDLLGLAPDDVARAIRDVAPEPFRASQLLRWIYERRVFDFARMTDLPKPMREALVASFTIGVPSVVSRTGAEDGAVKYLLSLADGARIEAVYIPMKEGDRVLRGPSATASDVGSPPGRASRVLRGPSAPARDLGSPSGRASRVLRGPSAPARDLGSPSGRASRVTICLSSQAGCAVDCAFCVTGRMGAGRNLTAGEIVGQYLVIAAERGLASESVNLVFMGMGEPLLNVPNVLRALDLLEREIAPRRITLSTSGVVPGLAPLAARARRPNLAVSLSAPDDATRTRLMPINATHPIGALFDALARWPLEKGRRITFEYVLIEGVNDTPAMARALARLVSRVPSKVNLIPLNESREWLPGLRRPADAAVDAFGRVLADAGVAVTVRWSKGLGANAACGQLKGRETPRRPERVERPRVAPRAVPAAAAAPGPNRPGRPGRPARASRPAR